MSATVTDPRPLRGEARRELIADAALTVVARVGPEALTHRLVAAEAGLPLSATTYWFASKADIVQAAFARAADRGIERLERARGERRWTRATIARELAALVETASRRERVAVDWGLWVEAMRHPELRPIAERWTDAYDAFLLDVLRATGVGRAEAADAQVLAATLEGLVSRQLARATPLPRGELTALLQRLLDALDT